jgi:hypothetical protein
MLKTVRTIAALAAAGALLAVPATGLAAKGGQGNVKPCKKTPSVGYQVTGTLSDVTGDDPATPAFEGPVTLTVTAANSHARNSGEIADQDLATEAVEVVGATYVVPAGDFVLRLNGYEGTDTPSVGDQVKVSGRIARTKKRCAAVDTTTANRYAAPDIRRVTITDRDPDA